MSFKAEEHVDGQMIASKCRLSFTLSCCQISQTLLCVGSRVEILFTSNINSVNVLETLSSFSA